MGYRTRLEAVVNAKNLLPLLGTEPWPSSLLSVAILTELSQRARSTFCHYLDMGRHDKLDKPNGQNKNTGESQNEYKTDVYKNRRMVVRDLF